MLKFKVSRRQAVLAIIAASSLTANASVGVRAETSQPQPGAEAASYASEVVQQGAALTELIRQRGVAHAMNGYTWDDFDRNLTVAFAKQEVAAHDASNWVETNADALAQRAGNGAQGFAIRAVGSAVSAPVKAVELFDASSRGASRPLVNLADGKPVSWTAPIQGSVDALSHKKAVLADVAIDALAGHAGDKIGKEIITPTRGAKPQKLITRLTGQHAKDEVKRQIVGHVGEQAVNVPLDQAKKVAEQVAKTRPSTPSSATGGQPSTRRQLNPVPSQTAQASARLALNSPPLNSAAPASHVAPHPAPAPAPHPSAPASHVAPHPAPAPAPHAAAAASQVTPKPHH